jgi:hypothetical protein
MSTDDLSLHINASNIYPYNVDAVEKTPEYLAIKPEVDRLIEEKFANDEMFLGRCHQVWAFKKHILKEKYGIDWHTPAEMNPYICFD